MENTETEIKSAGVIVSILCALLVAITQTGCGNTRLYIGVDDYGEPQEFHHDFKTRGNGDGQRTQNKGERY